MTSKRARKLMMACGIDRNLSNSVLRDCHTKIRYMDNDAVANATVQHLYTDDIKNFLIPGSGRNVTFHKFGNHIGITLTRMEEMKSE